LDVRSFIERVDFVTIPTRDVHRAQAFYNGVLGPSATGASSRTPTATC